MSNRIRFEKYQQNQTKKTVSMLKELVKRIEKGELTPISHGFWISGLDNQIQFRISVKTDDIEKSSGTFNKIS